MAGAEMLNQPEVDSGRRIKYSSLILEDVDRFLDMTQELLDYSGGLANLQLLYIQDSYIYGDTTAVTVSGNIEFTPCADLGSCGAGTLVAPTGTRIPHQYVAEVARRHDLALHMDGARLLNAAVASGAQRSSVECTDRSDVDRSRGRGIEGELGRRAGEEDAERESGEAGCSLLTIIAFSTPHPLPYGVSWITAQGTESSV